MLRNRLRTSLLHPALAAAVLTLLVSGCSGSAPTGTAATGTSSSGTPPNVSVAVAKKYADGTYSAAGTYTTPGGPESITVSVTLKNGVIADASVQGTAKLPISKKYIDNFVAGFKEQVVGKSIDGLSLTVVNGSSLTPKGFIDAIQKIQKQATSV